MARTKIEIGAKLGAWIIADFIKAGGNAEVWKVVKPGNPERAMKNLMNRGVVDIKRFENEIKSINENSDIDGIINIIDSHACSEGGDNLWYVMPIGEPLENVISRIEYREIMKLFIGIGVTIEKLHDRNISHRDIKPQNVLYIDGRLKLADFGLVKFPEREELTPPRRDVGPKHFMAPEMRRKPRESDGRAADVFSFIKTLWSSLTGQLSGFDGQYNANSGIGLKMYLKEVWTTTLDELFVECSDGDPENRPIMSNIISRLEEWLEIVDNFEKRNLIEWVEILGKIFPVGAPVRAEWSDIDIICQIITIIGSAKSLNHMFYPNRGGNTITKAMRSKEEGLIEIHALGVFLLRPRKLSFESFGVSPDWNYFRLEAHEIEPIFDRSADLYDEYLLEVGDGSYEGAEIISEFDATWPEVDPRFKLARKVSRFFRGSFVIFSTRSPYNLDSSTYDARHEKMSEVEFRNYISRNAEADSRA